MNTLRRLLASAVLVLLIQGTGLAADADDAILGTFDLNKAKSTFSPGPGPQRGSFTHTRNADGSVTWTNEGVNAQGNAGKTSATYKLDGKDYAVTNATGEKVGSIAMRVLPDGNVEATNKTAEGKTTIVNIRTIAADGQSFTLTGKGTNAQGQPVSNVIVYERRR